MKISEVRLNERSFWDTITNLGGDAPQAQPSTADVEGKAQADFKNTFTSRATSAFLNAWKNDGIDLNKSGLQSAPSAAPAAVSGAQGGARSGSTTAPSAAQPSQAGKTGGMFSKIKGMFSKGKAAAPAAAPAAAAPTAGVAKPAAKGAKSPGNAAIPAGQKQVAAKPQVDVNVDKAVNTMRSLQPTGTKPLPAKNAQELNKTLQLVSKNKDYLLIAADKINKFNQAGYDMKPFHKSFMAQHALGKKQKTIQEEFFIAESLFLADSKYSSWNGMLSSLLNEQSSADGESPSAFMYLIVKQMLQGYNFEKVPSIKKQIDTALVNWEKALVAQINKAGGKFDGRFDSNTQSAFDNLSNVVASTAFASLGPGGQQPKGQQTPTT